MPPLLSPHPDPARHNARHLTCCHRLPVGTERSVIGDRMKAEQTNVVAIGSRPGSRTPVRRRWNAGKFAALVLVALSALLVPSIAAAQLQDAAPIDADTVQEFRMHDGTTIRGRVVSQLADSITIETVGGISIAVARADISSVRTASGRIVDGRFVPADPNRTRLFFGPTARPLQAGEAYVSSYMLFFPFAGYGITDRLSIAGGTPIFPEILGEVFYFAPKFTVLSRPNTDLAMGALALVLSGSLDEGSAGIVYGVGTFGEPHRAVSLGAGWGFALGRGESRIAGDPVLLAGGELRMTDRTKLLTENWIAVGGGGTDGVLTGGLRFFGERLSADFGIGLAMDRDSVQCCLPLVNFVYHFPRN